MTVPTIIPNYGDILTSLTEASNVPTSLTNVLISLTEAFYVANSLTVTSKVPTFLNEASNVPPL